ncbi:MAG: BON domain-containing protein [Deltaproteobacteria bacterium]
MTVESEGQVTLTGSIRSVPEMEKAEQVARECSGVTSVKNEIRIAEAAWL